MSFDINKIVMESIKLNETSGDAAVSSDTHKSVPETVPPSRRDPTHNSEGDTDEKAKGAWESVKKLGKSAKETVQENPKAAAAAGALGAGLGGVALGKKLRNRRRKQQTKQQ